MAFSAERFPRVAPEARDRFEHWARLLREWNSRVNLVSRRDLDQLEAHHLAPCLALTNHLRLMDGARILDLGTGGGLPGLPLAICYPQARFLLVDSIRKKTDAVADMAERLGLRNVEVRHARGETLMQTFDFVTGRAVKDLPTFMTWVRNRVRQGRRHSHANGVLYWKGGDLGPELASLGIRPRTTINLEQELDDPYFAAKHILHFDARDLPRIRTR